MSCNGLFWTCHDTLCHLICHQTTLNQVFRNYEHTNKAADKGERERLMGT